MSQVGSRLAVASMAKISRPRPAPAAGVCAIDCRKASTSLAVWESGSARLRGVTDFPMIDPLICCVS